LDKDVTASHPAKDERPIITAVARRSALRFALAATGPDTSQAKTTKVRTLMRFIISPLLK
jgi:hypothetical protein